MTIRMKQLFFGALLLTAAGLPVAGAAEVSVHIGIYAPPPAFVISAPPPVAVVPGTYVYVIPDISVEILFYNGYWYRPYEDRWYRSRSYNGPWTYLAPSYIPRAIISLPPHYHVQPGYRRIPHAEFKKNWGRWGRERYWERDREWQAGRAKHQERGYERREGHPGRGMEHREGH